MCRDALRQINSLAKRQFSKSSIDVIAFQTSVNDDFALTSLWLRFVLTAFRGLDNELISTGVESFPTKPRSKSITFPENPAQSSICNRGGNKTRQKTAWTSQSNLSRQYLTSVESCDKFCVWNKRREVELPSVASRLLYRAT